MSLRALLSQHRHKILPAFLTLALAAVVVIFWRPLYAWFSLQPSEAHPHDSKADSHAANATSGDPHAIAFYTCPMHPSVRQQGPGTCPLCSMDLAPVTEGEVQSGVIFIDEGRRQKIGVRTGPVIKKPLVLTIRAVGVITYDESRLEDVTLRLGGFIERLYVEETGAKVKKGQPLLSLYSPELYAAQEDYLLALQSQAEAQQTGAPDRADYLVRASEKRLKLLGLTQEQIEKIAHSKEPLEHVPLVSPASGYVIEKDVVEGASVMAGQRLFRIAALDKIWVEAELYEADLPQITVGHSAKISLPYLPGKEFSGKVTHIYPFLDGKTRTGRVRIELDNPGLALKPEMYADVELVVEKGEQLLVPASAVLYTGPRKLVFVDQGEGRFQPREVELGQKNNDFYEVIKGLSEGEVVVTSGNFLVAAESRLKSAADAWGGDDEAR